ncbi:MAG: hypothetical protein PHO02_00190 [Candidatus Nanoarchaeia archaeon]|nr:hypothetical protein [Candidatus Nanoarchaeia archaeon]
MKREVVDRICKGIGYTLLGSFLYVCSGPCYAMYKSMNISSNMEGQNNREKTEEYYEEFEKERKSLEQRLRTDNDNEETIVETDIYVSESLKYFFDDKDNLNDNDDWARKVEKAVSGLDAFEDYGYDFRVRYVRVIPESIEKMGFKHITYYMAGREDTAEFNISLVPNPLQKYSFWERIQTDMVFGMAYVGHGYGMVYLDNNDSLNRHTLAHEAGHMLNLIHREENAFLTWFDPFYFGERGLMSQGNLNYSDYTLNETEIAIIGESKKRF